MEKQYLLPGKLRDALVSFLRTMPMETVEEPVTMLRGLKPLNEPTRTDPPTPPLLDTPA